MPQESSAGGVVVRDENGQWWMAVIKPRGRNTWALPKGHVDPGETAAQAAQREVLEETGIRTRLDTELGEIRYVYQFRGKRIFKRVTFFLLEYLEGEIDKIDEKMRVEVDLSKWIPLETAPRYLTYAGERDMALKALKLLDARATQSKPT